MLTKIATILFTLVLVLCVCNSLLGTYNFFLDRSKTTALSVLHYYTPTLVMGVFYYFSVLRRKRTLS